MEICNCRNLYTWSLKQQQCSDEEERRVKCKITELLKCRNVKRENVEMQMGRRRASWTSLAPRRKPCRSGLRRRRPPVSMSWWWTRRLKLGAALWWNLVVVPPWVPYKSWRDSTKAAESATSRAATIEEGGAGRMQPNNSRRPSGG